MQFVWILPLPTTNQQKKIKKTHIQNVMWNSIRIDRDNNQNGAYMGVCLNVFDVIVCLCCFVCCCCWFLFAFVTFVSRAVCSRTNRLIPFRLLHLIYSANLRWLFFVQQMLWPKMKATYMIVIRCSSAASGPTTATNDKQKKTKIQITKQPWKY